MRCNRFSALLAIAAVILHVLATSAGAAIVIEDQTTINGPGGAHYNPVNFGSYDAIGSDKLVVLVGGGRDRGSSLGINSVTYGSTTLTEAVKVSSTITSPQGVAAGIYYLDSPGAAGDLVVDYAGASWGIRNAITVLELLGTAAGHGPVASSPDSPTVSLATVADDSLVLAISKGVPDGDTEVPLSPLTNLNASRHGAGYQFVASPATVTPSFSGWSVTGAGATVAAAFEAAGGGPGPGPVDIPVANGSFELPPRGDGGYGLADDWDLWGPAADAGNWNPEGYQFTSGAPDGDHVGWAYQYAPLTGTPNGLTQVLTTAFEADTQYELTVEIGNAWDYYFSGYGVQLLAGGTVIAEDNNTLHPPWEEWDTSTVSYSYDPAHAGLVGLPLEIRLLSLGLDPEGGGTDVEVEFDAVSLTALSTAVVPEPSTFVLAALGLLGLAFCGRRRRRLP